MTKKTFTVYGNCQSTIIAASLQRIKSFADNYQYVRLPPCHRITSDQYQKFASNIKDIDLLITQPVSSNFRGGGFDSHYLSRSARNVLRVPSLQFYGYFPSLSRFTIPRVSEAKSININSILAPYPSLSRDSLYHYNEIKSMVAKKIPSSLICYHFDHDRGQESQVEKCLSWTLNYLSEKESTFDLVPISDYLENNWQNKLLFYTPRHPSGHVMAEMIKRICSKLNLSVYNHELNKIEKRDHFSALKLYIPKWLREGYLSSISQIQNEDFFTMSAADNVALYANLYRLIPSLLMD